MVPTSSSLPSLLQSLQMSLQAGQITEPVWSQLPEDESITSSIGICNITASLVN